jgi:hypothetical protein
MLLPGNLTDTGKEANEKARRSTPLKSLQGKTSKRRNTKASAQDDV